MHRRLPGTAKPLTRDNADAQNNLGVMYENGHGVSQDYAQAMAWYRKAADQGYAEAQYTSGNVRELLVCAQDYAQAMAVVSEGRRSGKRRRTIYPWR